jgi:hypothetical protein
VSGLALQARSSALLALLLGCTESAVPSQGAGADNTGAAGSSGASSSLGGGLLVPPPSYARRCDEPGDLRCQKHDCPADASPSTTSVSGVVYDPAGRVPLYNALVYVVDPRELPALGKRVQCESCGANFPKAALAYALSDSQGRFSVTDMPAGDDVPLIVQLGKWRRLVKVPHVEACENTELPAELTRLPRSSSEGDLPKIAVTTGASDALECLLQKIGIELDEFTPDSGNGRVNLFAGYGAATQMVSGGATLPLTPAEVLWADADKMLDYDMMLMSCEGNDNLWNSPDDKGFPVGATPRPAAMHLQLRKYADLGGRIFGSHWHHRWINSDDVTPNDPYPPVASFAKTAKDIGDVTVSVDATFPKGLAFRDWLLSVGASTTLGELSVVKAEHSVDAVDEALAKRWIYGTDPGGKAGTSRVPEMVQYFSFTTPVGSPECGRMVFSDVHVSFGGTAPTVPFPERCSVSSTSQLSPQEKALEFMIFDLSSCIQKEADEVSSPITVVK